MRPGFEVVVTSSFSKAVKFWRDRLSKNSLLKGILHYISYHYNPDMKDLYATDMKTDMKTDTDDSLES